MKLRRALVTVAATAAIGPAALCTAPSAFAAPESPGATPTTTATSTTTSTATPPSTATPADGKTPTSGASPTASPTTSSPAPTRTATASPSATASASPSATGAPTRTQDPCEIDSRLLRTELRGLAGEIVAGSGWHEFAYRATNTSDRELHSVAAYVEAYSFKGGSERQTSEHLTLQWFNPAAGQWQTIPRGSGYFAEVHSLKPREYADARLRLRIDAKAPAGYGAAFQVGYYQNADRKCGYSEGAYYPFEVLAAGSRPGSDGDSKPTGRRPGPSGGDNRPAPQGGLSKLPVTGELARTGSSSSMPTVAAISGVAVLAGAGAIVVARRRKSAGDGA